MSRSAPSRKCARPRSSRRMPFTPGAVACAARPRLSTSSSCQKLPRRRELPSEVSPMNDEELLKAVGRSARARQPLDERFEELAADRLSDAEREKLLEEAATSEEASEAYEAYRPLGAEFQA